MCILDIRVLEVYLSISCRERHLRMRFYTLLPSFFCDAADDGNFYLKKKKKINLRGQCVWRSLLYAIAVD